MSHESLHPAATWFRITIYCTKNLNKRTIEFMIFDSNKYILVQAKLPSLINKLSTMFVYSDILLNYLR